MFRLEKLLPLAACNRCADYHSARNRMEDNLLKAAQQYRFTTNSDMKSKARVNIISITKAYAKIVCDHFRVVETWNPDMPEGIMDHPDKVLVSLKFYHRSIEDLAQAARYAPEPIQSEHVAQ